MPSLASLIKFKSAQFRPYYNTRTPIDVAVGQFIRGYKGEWLNDGGASPINAFSGRSGYYKTTIVDNLVLRLLEIYPGSEYFKMDTENTSTSGERFKKLSGGKVDVDSRVHITNKGEVNFTEYCQMQKELGEAKLAHQDDYIVETPFVDPTTGKAYRILMPTFQSLDSISNLVVAQNLEAIEKDIEDKKTNTADMLDGKMKKRLVDLMVTWAYKYNFVYFITAHIGEKQDIDPRRSTPKQNQWMSNSEKVTNAGKNFLYLPNLSFQLVRPTPLVDQDKNPLYPSAEATLRSIKKKADSQLTELEQIELNRLSLKILRGKNNVTGTIIPTVMSQHQGILADLSYYEYLVEVEGNTKSGEVGDSGFLKKGYNRVSPLLPDFPLNRKNIRQLCKTEYRVERMLEIMFQFHWVSHYWNTAVYPFDVPATLEAMVNGILSGNSIMLDDLLESRSYWTYDKKDKRPYYSIFDICELIGIREAPVSVQVPSDITPSK